MKIEITQEQYFNLENLSTGVYKPLENFMTFEEYTGVVKDMLLPNGEVMPLPILLDVDESQSIRARAGDKISLFYCGEEVGIVIPESIYKPEKRLDAVKIFGTDDIAHPGVNRFLSSGDWAVGGETRLVKKLQTDISKYQITPEKMHEWIEKAGFSTFAGFQTRNIPHRAHEYLQKIALEVVDGLFINPLLGAKKTGDFRPEVIMDSYETLVKEFYPKDRVVLKALSASMFYAGPREAIFHALIRRNYGCTHFIVGRDHAGVGDYYSLYEAQDLAVSYEDALGIKILALAGPYFCKRCNAIVSDRSCSCRFKSEENCLEISGTLIRRMLTNGEKIDERLIRREIVDGLKSRELFI